jgi:hypothetical protein
LIILEIFSADNSAYISPPRSHIKFNNAPKAELDAMSVDSMPFEASRYDNLELVQRRSSIQLQKRLVAAGGHKKSN